MRVSFLVEIPMYYLVSVKPFYISLLTSKRFRKTFIKGLMKWVPRRHRVGIGMFQTVTQTQTLVRNTQRK